MSIDKLDLRSPDLVNANFEKLAILFPNCVTETANGKAIDFDMLKQELSHAVIEGNKERYRLEWPGKREAIVTANLPTTKTLRPVREDSVDFDNTENIYIEGDNLEVLKLLQESYLGKIKLIYIDPPYNTGRDFVYKDNFAKDAQQELIESGQKDEYNQRLVVNPETSGRYHSDWLSMIYPRLKLARNLLKNDGIIMISIGPDEIYNLLNICNEIFGSINNAGIMVRQAKTGGNTGKFFSPNVEYILVFIRDIATAEGFKTTMDEELIRKVYTQIETEGERKGEKYRIMGLYQASLRDLRPNQKYFIECPDGTKVLPPCSIQDEIMRTGDGRWRWVKDKYLKELEKGNVVFKKSKSKVLVDSNGDPSNWNIYTKIWLNDREEEGQVPNDLILKFENRHSSKELQELDIPFDFAKPTGLIKYLFEISQLEDNDIVLDFFSGSATTAHALMKYNSEYNKKAMYLQVQLPELTEEKSAAFKAGYKNICELGKERIRRAGNKIREDLQGVITSLMTKLTNASLDIEKEQIDNLLKNQDRIDELNTEIEELKIEIDFKKNILDELDTGFRVYSLSASNMQDVYYKPQDYKQEAMDLFADNVKPDRTPDDLLAQVMLDWGLSLSLKIEQINISGKQVFKVAENSLFACFDKGIDEDFAKAIAKDAPLRIVFRDNGFTNDTAKTNVKQLLKQLSPETEMKVI